MEIGEREKAAEMSLMEQDLTVSQSESESEELILKPEQSTFLARCGVSQFIACNTQTGNGIGNVCVIFFVMVMAISGIVIPALYIK
jgi:hypothetical protein